MVRTSRWCAGPLLACVVVASAVAQPQGPVSTSLTVKGSIAPAERVGE